MKMLRRIRNSAARFPRISPPLAIRERAVTAPLAVGPTVPGAHTTPGEEGEMRRITHISRTLVVAAVFVSTAVLAAAFPLVALAGDGNPQGG
jgi:hypothetical protein